MFIEDDIKEIDVNLRNGSVVQIIDINNVRLLTAEQVIEIIPVSIDDLSDSRVTGALLGVRAPLFSFINGQAYYLSSVVTEWVFNLPQAHKLNGKKFTRYHLGNSERSYDWDLV
jgi:hypothetical protein